MTAPRHRFALLTVPAALLLATAALAGPPFLTDDPEPVPYRHWEAYLFGILDDAAGDRTGQGPAVELNYGFAPGFMAHLIVPVAFSSPAGGPAAAGFGDVTMGLKVRFVTETGRRPEVGIFPMLSLPTGSARRGLGNGRPVLQLPVWVQKSWGAWTSYGGGGVTLNGAPGARDSAFAGWLLERQLTPALLLGGEVFTQGRTAGDAPGTTIVNAGGQLALTRILSLLFSGGASVAGAHHTVAYLALYATWGP